MNFFFTFMLLIGVVNANTTIGHLPDLFKKLVSWDESLLILYDKENKDCLRRIMPSNPRLLWDINRPFRGSFKWGWTYIFCISNNQQLKKTMTKLRYSGLWDLTNSPHGKYLVISNGVDLAEMSNMFWNYQVTNVILLKRQDDVRKSQGICKNRRIMKHCNVPHKYVIIKNVVKIPKPRKIVLALNYDFKNLKKHNHYMMHSVIFKMVEVMRNALKIKQLGHTTLLQFHLQTPSKKVNDELWFMLYDSNHKTFLKLYDVSDIFITETLKWILPRTRKIQTQSLLFVFNWEPSFMLLFVFIVFVLMGWSFARLLKDYAILQSVLIWMVIATQLTVTMSACFVPRSLSLQILFVFFMFYSFQISNWYQSYMTSILVDPALDDEIESIQQLSRSNITLLIDHYHMQNFLKKNRNYDLLKDKFKDIEKHRDSWENYAKNGMGFLYGEEAMRYAKAHYLTMFYPLQHDNVQELSQSFFLKKGHYFLPTLNRFRERLVESGWQQKFFNNIRTEGLLLHNKKQEESPVTNIYLQLQHLQEAFMLLGGGLALAAFALCCEFIYHFACKRSTKLKIK